MKKIIIFSFNFNKDKKNLNYYGHNYHVKKELKYT